MDIRFVLPSEVEQLARNVVTFIPSKTPAALLQNMEGELHRPDEGRYLGCFDDDGTLLGSILMMDFTLNVRGVMMPMGAAAYVSANFLHKKERVACTLLKVLMRYYAKQGTPIGCLHPFNPAFYANMGYGYCNENYLYQPQALRDPLLRRQVRLSYARPGGPSGDFGLLPRLCGAYPRCHGPPLYGPPPDLRHALRGGLAAGTAGSPATSPSISWRWTLHRHVPRLLVPEMVYEVWIRCGSS